MRVFYLRVCITDINEHYYYRTCERGDIDAFNNIVSDRKEEIAAQPALVNRADFIKVYAMCVLLGWWCFIVPINSHL